MEKYLVLDVETAGNFSNPLCYDIGFKVIDADGRVYDSASYVVKEIFDGEKYWYNNPTLMETAYYTKKLPQYYAGLKTGAWKKANLLYIRKHIWNTIERNNVTAVCAYNAKFDVNALNQTIRYVTKSKIRDFFPSNLPIYDIWRMSCDSICLTDDFLNTAYFEKWESECGNVRTSAEILWRYLSHNVNFEESHTGLADVEIECAILLECLKYSLEDFSITHFPWKIPQPPYHALKNEKF